jgi:hypothetical protein
MPPLHFFERFVQTSVDDLPLLGRIFVIGVWRTGRLGGSPCGPFHHGNGPAVPLHDNFRASLNPFKHAPDVAGQLRFGDVYDRHSLNITPRDKE